MGVSPFNRPVTTREWFRAYHKALSVSERWQQIKYKIEYDKPTEVDKTLLSQAIRLALLSLCYDKSIEYAERLTEISSSQESISYIKALEFKALSLYLKNTTESISDLKSALNNWPQRNAENNACAEILSLLIDNKLDAEDLIHYPKFVEITKEPAPENYFFKLFYADAYAASMTNNSNFPHNKIKSKVDGTLEEARKLASKCNEENDNPLIRSYESQIYWYIGAKRCSLPQPKSRIQELWEEYIEYLRLLSSDPQSEETVAAADLCIRTIHFFDKKFFVKTIASASSQLYEEDINQYLRSDKKFIDSISAAVAARFKQ